MEIFIQSTAMIFLTIVLSIVLERQGKEFSLLLTLIVCCILAGIAVGFLTPVIELIRQLQAMARLDGQLLQVLLKAVGIGMVGEIATMICNDSGNSALGKVLQLVTTSVILWLSIPLLQRLLELLQEILGDV